MALNEALQQNLQSFLWASKIDQNASKIGNSAEDDTLKTILRYTLERRLGQGNFADVWKAHHRLGSNNKLTVAIKVIDKTQRSESDLTKIYREIEILKKLRHPHIIRLYQVFESGNYIFLGM